MKILVTDNMNAQALDMLRKDFQVDLRTGLNEDQLVSLIPDYEVLLVRSSVKVTERVIKAGTKLKIIGRPGVGVDNIDVKAATAENIAVINTPLGNINAVAEYTFALMLSLSRNIPKASSALKDKKLWDRKHVGVELKEKTLGIVGFGNIGKIVARIAKHGFMMDVITFDPFISEEDAAKHNAKLVELDELLEKSDFITIHVPFSEKTKNLISDSAFAKMKKTARLINAARGGVVDETALYNALKSGKIAGAAVDVWAAEPCTNSSLFEFDNVITMPHLGGSTIEAQENVAIDIAIHVLESFRSGMIQYSLNGIKELKE